jgi:hypothetical protein
MPRTELLLEEREENGDDDPSLNRLTEDDKEDGDGKGVRHGASDGEADLVLCRRNWELWDI